jgi:hypothetical protein
MDGVDEVYHLAGLPGMWLPRKADFYTVNCSGTEIAIETARERGIKRFLHCSTESILFRASPSIDSLADDAFLPALPRSSRESRQRSGQRARSVRHRPAVLVGQLGRGFRDLGAQLAQDGFGPPSIDKVRARNPRRPAAERRQHTTSLLVDQGFVRVTPHQRALLLIDPDL